MRTRDFFLLLLGWAASVGHTHELETFRTTLVVHDVHHVTMTMRLPCNAALAPALSVANPTPMSLLELSALARPHLGSLLEQTRTRWEESVQLHTATTRLPWRQWRWPDVDRLQACLRAAAMQALVNPGEHHAADTLDIQADATSTRPLTAFVVHVPAELQPMLVVAYRPIQGWVKAGRFDVHLSPPPNQP